MIGLDRALISGSIGEVTSPDQDPGPSFADLTPGGSASCIRGLTPTWIGLPVA
jgi:hypothetical protein